MDAQADSWVILDGALLPAGDAAVPLADRALALGDGVFTTLGVRNGVAWRLKAHIRRLVGDAVAVLGLSEAVAGSLVAHVADAALLTALLDANGLSQRDAVLRICVSAGAAPRGLKRPTTKLLAPRCWITALPATTTLGPRLTPGLRVATVSAPWLDGLAAVGLTQVKHTSRLPWVLARERGADYDEVLLCNAAGDVVSASAHNVFALDADGKTLRTPPPTAGALPGIARAAVIEAAHDHGLTVAETTLSPETLDTAQAVWLTNSLVRIASVATINDKPIPVEHPVTQHIAAILAQE